MAREATSAGSIRTLEGTMKYRKGDFIAKGHAGETWPIRREIFKHTHQKVAEGATSPLLKCAGVGQGFRDLWTVIRSGRLGATAREAAEGARDSQAVRELLEPVRDFAAWAKTPAGKRGLAAGTGFALASGAGVAYLDRVQDQSLLPS